MKILFAIQGTGNGHFSRAIDIYPELVQYGQVDVLVSGIQVDIKFPFPVKYKLYGFGFIFGGSGGVDIWKTIRTTRLPRLIKDIRSFPIEQYDLVVNDFEPVSSWACKLKSKPCIALSHQSAVLHPAAPAPVTKDMVGKLVLQRYAPANAYYGFHFKSFADNIYTPVIRKKIRETIPTDQGHYTVYLPSYDDKVLLQHLSQFKQARWQVFSKHNKQPFNFENVSIQPVENEAFVKSMTASTGVLCGAGFEGPAETLYLGKKLLVIPMHNQYEQHCNAAALKSMGVPVINLLAKKNYSVINNWINNSEAIKVDYPDRTAEVVARLIKEHGISQY